MVEDLYYVMSSHEVVECASAVIDRARHREGVVAVQDNEIRFLLLQHRDHFVDSLAVLLTAPESAAQVDVREHHDLKVAVGREGVIACLRVDLRDHSVYVAVIHRLKAVDVVPQTQRHSEIDQVSRQETEHGDHNDPDRYRPVTQTALLFLYSLSSQMLLRSFLSAHMKVLSLLGMGVRHR